MKRARDENLDEDEEALLLALVSKLKKHRNEATTDYSTSLASKRMEKEDESKMEEKINEIVGDIMHDSIIEKKELAAEVKQYSFCVKYPNLIKYDQLHYLSQIKNIVKVQVEEHESPEVKGIMKISLTYTSDPRIKIQYNRQDIVAEEPKFTTAAPRQTGKAESYIRPLMQEIESNIIFDHSDPSEPITTKRHIEKYITVVSYTNQIVCPLRVEKIQKMRTNKIIKDVKFIANPSNNKVRIIFEVFNVDDEKPTTR